MAQVAKCEELPFGSGNGRRGGELAGRGGSEKIDGEDQVLLDGRLPLPWVWLWEMTAVFHRKPDSGRNSVQ